MLRHVVLFDLTEDATEEMANAAVEGLLALRDTVPSVRALSCGRDAGLVEGNAGIALVVDTDDEAGWRAYQEHPEHVRVATTLVRPIMRGRTAAQHTR